MTHFNCFGRLSWQRAPSRIDEFPSAVENHFWAVCYEALDLVTSCVKTRFNQEDYRIHSACESLLLKAVTSGNFSRAGYHC